MILLSENNGYPIQHGESSKIKIFREEKLLNWPTYFSNKKHIEVEVKTMGEYQKGLVGKWHLHICLDNTWYILTDGMDKIFVEIVGDFRYSCNSTSLFYHSQGFSSFSETLYELCN